MLPTEKWNIEIVKTVFRLLSSISESVDLGAVISKDSIFMKISIR